MAQTSLGAVSEGEKEEASRMVGKGGRHEEEEQWI